LCRFAGKTQSGVAQIFDTAQELQTLRTNYEWLLRGGEIAAEYLCEDVGQDEEA
jgi:hypothetical protein